MLLLKLEITKLKEAKNVKNRFPLIGERVSLVPLETDDIRAMAPFFSDVKEIYYYLPDALLPRNLKQLESLMEDWNDGKENFVFACRLKEKTIGLVTLSYVDPISGHAELGVMLAEPEYRGRGLAQEAMRLIIDYAFSELRLHRLYARVARDNEASLKLFRQLGFTEEGTMREAMRREGRYIDLLFFGLLEQEYKPLPPPSF